MDILHGCFSRFDDTLEGEDGNMPAGVHAITVFNFGCVESGSIGHRGVGGDSDGAEVEGVAYTAVIVHEDAGAELFFLQGCLQPREPLLLEQRFFFKLALEPETQRTVPQGGIAVRSHEVVEAPQLVRAQAQQVVQLHVALAAQRAVV